jgi:hypothetical protein
MTPFWQTVIFAVILVCVLAVTVIALVALAAWQRRQRQQTTILTIANDGNERSRYDLRAESASGALSFRFVAGGIPLAPSGVVVQAPLATSTGPAVRPVEAAAPPVSPAVPEQPSGPPLAGLVAELLVTIGYVLPGSAGTALRNAASQIRYGQSAADKAAKLGGRVSRVAGSAAATGQQIAGTVGGGQAAPAAAAAAEPASTYTPSELWWRTAYVEPGASLGVEVQIGPGAASPGAAETYRVLTRSAERGDAAIVAEDGVARLGGAGGLARWLPYLAILALALLVSLGAYGAVQTVFPVR